MIESFFLAQAEASLSMTPVIEGLMSTFEVFYLKHHGKYAI